MTRPTPTSTLSAPSHSTIHSEPVNIKMFDADAGSGEDDTAALQAAITESANGGSIFLPTPSSGYYNITSTIDLSAVGNLHIIGGHEGANASHFGLGQFPPAVAIDGTTITTGALFYCNAAGGTANHHWENLSVSAGRTGFHYLEAANMVFTNLTVGCYTVDGNQKNAAIVMENSFWAWYERCGFRSPNGVTTLPSVLMLTNDHVINAVGGLHRFYNCTFWHGGTKIHVEETPPQHGNFYFENCLTEATSIPFLEITEAASGMSSWHMVNLGFRNCSHADQIVDSPMVKLNAANCTLDSPVFENCPNPEAIVQVTAGTADGTLVTGTWGNGTGRYQLNAAGTASAGNIMSHKPIGFDVIGDDFTYNETSNGQLVHAGPAVRLGRAGEAAMRYGIGTSGKQYWGNGTAAYDTTLYRNAADQLKTDDKFIAAAGIGVGNSASASAVGTLSKKMEVFDASGASLGFVPIYTTIT